MEVVFLCSVHVSLSLSVIRTQTDFTLSSSQRETRWTGSADIRPVLSLAAHSSSPLTLSLPAETRVSGSLSASVLMRATVCMYKPPGRTTIPDPAFRHALAPQTFTPRTQQKRHVIFFIISVVHLECHLMITVYCTRLCALHYFLRAASRPAAGGVSWSPFHNNKKTKNTQHSSSKAFMKLFLQRMRLFGQNHQIQHRIEWDRGV